jgi:protein-tyrosine phosphatase
MSENLKSASFLFVCTGNICRSPTAEALFRHKIGEFIVDYEGVADSAGLQGYHIGDPPDGRSIRTAARKGIDMADLRARKVQIDDFRQFDHIIAMDRGHFKGLKSMAPADGTAQVTLLLDHHPDYQGRDVPDPYYGTAQDFEETYRLIDIGLDAMISRIFGENA